MSTYNRNMKDTEEYRMNRQKTSKQNNSKVINKDCRIHRIT